MKLISIQQGQKPSVLAIKDVIISNLQFKLLLLKLIIIYYIALDFVDFLYFMI